MENHERYYEIHVIVKGYVQGVGYRFFAERQAIRMGILGWVRNLINGDVELVVQGSKDNLERYIHELNQGSRSSTVDELIVKWRDPTTIYESFTITY